MVRCRIQGLMFSHYTQLDFLWNPGESMLEKKWERERGKKEAKKRKGRRGKEVRLAGESTSSEGGAVEAGAVEAGVRAEKEEGNGSTIV